MFQLKNGDTLSTLEKAMNKPVLIVLIGLPGTGKSTYRKSLESSDINIIGISSDDYIESYAKMFNSTYDKVFEEAIQHTDRYIKDCTAFALNSKRSVVWDQTNLTVKKRKNILDKFKNYVKIAVDFKIPENWEQRLSNRPGKTIPPHILKSMTETYVEPTLEEGFDLIYQYNNEQ